MMGGALGLAVLASVAASRSSRLRSDGHSTVSALTGGYHAAFVIGALFAVTAAVIGASLFRMRAARAPEAAAA
jgi:hypothetical protein